MELKAVVLEELNLFDEMTDELVLEVIDRVLKNTKYGKNMSLNGRCLLRMELFHSIRKLDILEELLENPDITEIMINGGNGIFIEREGRLEAFSSGKISKERMEELVVKITAMSNRIVNEATPLTDARLGDGSRVHVAVSPVALDSPVITIRKFPKNPIALEDLLEKESFNEEIAEFLKLAVRAKYNIFVSGSTGSGKTTLLNVLSDFIPKNERIITIEDTAELQIRNVPNLVRLEARNSVVEGCREVTIRDLLRASLRMRPEAIHNEIVSYKVTKRVSPSHTHSLSTDLTMAFFSSAENASKFSRRCTISFFLSLALRSSRAAMRSSAARDRCSAFKD